MDGITTLFDRELCESVESIWSELERDFGVRGIGELTPIPHFSWLVAEEFDRPTLALALESIASTVTPFSVRTSGIGVFTGPSPVVYVPIVRSAALDAVHRELWTRCKSLARELKPIYAPDAWLPHVTLAMHDVTPALLPRIIDRLSGRDFGWQIRVDNLALLHHANEQAAEQISKVSFR